MKEKIRIGIVGYGNLGKGVEMAIAQNSDMCLEAVFTRRELPNTDGSAKFVPIANAKEYKDKIDVMILCGGSATDLPEQGPVFAAMFNTVDSFDTHPLIAEYFAKVNEVANEHAHTSLISTGWDPGLFSLNRLLAQSVLPQGEEQTFWGKGVSQGHSDAIRRIAGVKDAKQYTIPYQDALDKVRTGKGAELTTRDKHFRDCYVVAKDGADLQAIEEQIKTMPNYFSEYNTQVTFVSEAEFAAHHTEMPHGGFVFRNGQTSSGRNHVMEFSLKLDSNPEFTASVLVAYARAVFRMHTEGQKGAKTVFDIPFAYLSPKTGEELRKQLL